jgi:F-type H+-transporting ATPase subunit b
MDATNHTTSTGAAPKSGGFPPFDTKTFPSQFFWLAITFAFLFVVLWRVAGPRISGAIAARKGRIDDDFAQAESHRKDAETAQATYESALAEARKRAHSFAEENRKRMQDEIDRAKAAAEADAGRQMADAEARIQATRQSALAQISATAEEAAIAIVAHLTGETVSTADARAALAAAN